VSARPRRRIVVATRSAHKLRELRELLAVPDVELVSLDDLGIAGEPVEDGPTFEANARIKARFAARAAGLPALADDSGLEVEALGGRPGVHTRRYAGPTATDPENNAKLLRELAGLPPARRTARYVCVLALALPADTPDAPRRGLTVVTRRGTCRGRIATELRGSGGFGYDPIFEPAGEPPGGRTFGQYEPLEKHAISHRARAARRMRRAIADRAAMLAASGRGAAW
jgi:XTP/dITP diphosphohydrolase